MKKIIVYTFLLFSAAAWLSCKKSNYPGATVSSIIAVTDVRAIFKGADIQLTEENMFGANKIVGVVVSDHSGGNMPAGLLVVQNNRRSRLRGISIALGTDAAKYIPGDSVNIAVTGGTLTRINGILQITGIPASAVNKVASGITVNGARVASSAILANPDNYESTLVAVVKGGFDPLPAPTEKFTGDKVVNDGFGNIGLHTEATAAFANTVLPVSANFTGIIFGVPGAVTAPGTAGAIVPQLRMRKADDVKILSSVIEISPIIISGFLVDPNGTDANYEYIQFRATRDINFANEKFTVVTTNNAGASTPTGFPANGWATGDLRTYKLELTTGTVLKGAFFYVGGAGKKINGSASTDISEVNWIKAFNYSTTDSPNFNTSTPATKGTKTTNLLANSGNAAGIAVFSGVNILTTSKPIDVIFISNGGSLYQASPQLGYRIANTDFYDEKDLITLVDQPFYRQGSNTLFFAFPNAVSWAQLGGQYNSALGKWIAARALFNIPLTNTSALAEIEGKDATIVK